MKFTEHVELRDQEGCCLLTVWDTELHDFLDDFFTDRGIEAQVLLPAGLPQRHQLLFSPSTSRASVHRLLTEIGSAEIVRIASINRGSSSS